MIDAQILAAHRRNNLILNSLIMILTLSEKQITEFKIFEIKFEMTDNIPYIESFNEIILIAWIYSFFRYIISHKQFSIERIKQITLEESNAALLVNKEMDSPKLFERFSKFFVNESRIDFTLPSIFTISNIFIIENFNNIIKVLLFLIVILSLYGYRLVIEEERKIHSYVLTKKI
ncbi:hypothetical protein [Poseidonibacter lekithochrous]|uniref:hypothetical protein n=1 Tax=Poseidonibacter lekithochrous TaxID=1904463 RepID=UPI000D341AD2|nr:hypothetical protein [Poseidonibacter lekithochrous]